MHGEKGKKEIGTAWVTGVDGGEEEVHVCPKRANETNGTNETRIAYDEPRPIPTRVDEPPQPYTNPTRGSTAPPRPARLRRHHAKTKRERGGEGRAASFRTEETKERNETKEKEGNTKTNHRTNANANANLNAKSTNKHRHARNWDVPFANTNTKPTRGAGELNEPARRENERGEEGTAERK
ncbi:hypothetical protein K438DRAFT_1763003 [Mycena galopus ATCC 62051]|nr:hypothetical protein K438DRAFT_1763003 [Mycena galopus ATCC 62051]